MYQRWPEFAVLEFCEVCGGFRVRTRKPVDRPRIEYQPRHVLEFATAAFLMLSTKFSARAVCSGDGSPNSSISPARYTSASSMRAFRFESEISIQARQSPAPSELLVVASSSICLVRSMGWSIGAVAAPVCGLGANCPPRLLPLGHRFCDMPVSLPVYVVDETGLTRRASPNDMSVVPFSALATSPA